jgi:hypothetical protein
MERVAESFRISEGSLFPKSRAEQGKGKTGLAQKHALQLWAHTTDTWRASLDSYFVIWNHLVLGLALSSFCWC